MSALDWLGQLDGAEIPGGCDECETPYQTVKSESFGFVLTVHHDDWCPRLARYEGRTARNRAERRRRGS